ncbi:4Fe-4S ferredoxin [Archaeoglobales archaeon]|nr:MAG: 4Fe-4S ferredoxin [Archaeoglobales archaeon]
MRLNVDFTAKLKKFGAETTYECFNCGNCTAICPLSTNEEQFPRKFIRYLQLGLESKIRSSVEPWLCYYCGECQQTCPRQANPGELMMSVRRYLTTVYDWTGLSKRLYTSTTWKFLSVGILFFATLFIVYLLHGPIVTDHTELETFAPAEIVHPAGYVFGTILAVILLGNVYRMHKFIMGDTKAPFSLYIQELGTLIKHFAIQARLRLCENKSLWLKHWLLMTGYTAAFILVQVDILTFWSLTNNPPPAWHPAKILWTYATVAMLYATTVAIIGRLKKEEPIHQYSHSTDWMFLILLWLTVFTGFLVRIFMQFDLPLPTYYAFAIHLAFTVPLLGLEVPFTKWSHLAYRPFALYFLNVKRRALEGE